MSPKPSYPGKDTEYNGNAPCQRPPSPPPTIKNTKWATFTYPSPQIRKITNLFKHTNIRIAYKCTNTISHLSKPTNKASLPSSPYNRSRRLCKKLTWKCYYNKVYHLHYIQDLLHMTAAFVLLGRQRGPVAMNNQNLHSRKQYISVKQ